MTKPHESFDVGPLTVHLKHDSDPMSPREWDNLGVMACWHRRYTLGDEQPKGEASSYLAALPKGTVILPLYLYDHSGITIATIPFSCPWDSGQVGIIYCTPETIRKEMLVKRITTKTIERVKENLRIEVGEYDKFLTGDVWGYTIKDELGEERDSCWGFFGLDYCREQATESATHLASRLAEQSLFSTAPTGAD